MVDAHAEAADRQRRPHPDVMDALVEHQLLRLWVPASMGGVELDLPTSLEVFRAAAHLDGSVGWTVTIGVGGGLFGAFLPPATARRLFSPPDALVAGSGAPSGVADTDNAGEAIRVAGRWSYASGAHHATTFTATCVLHRHGQPVTGPDGRPQVRAVAVRPDDVEVLDTWDPVGLRATDSHDIVVAGATISPDDTFSLDEPPYETGPLYRFPFLSIAEASFAAAAHGLARRGVELFAELAATKTPHGFDRPLAQLPEAARRVARAEVELAAAEALLEDTVGPAWADVVDGGEVSAAQAQRLGAAARHGARTARASLAGLVEVAGMSVLPLSSPLGRAWRDLQVLTAHVLLSPLRDGTGAHHH